MDLVVLGTGEGVIDPVILGAGEGAMDLVLLDTGRGALGLVVLDAGKAVMDPGGSGCWRRGDGAWWLWVLEKGQWT